MKKILLLTVFNFSFLTLSCFAQNKNINGKHSQAIDTLLSLLKTDKSDTSKVIHLNNLSRGYFNIGLYDTAKLYSNKALQLAKMLNYKKGTCLSYNTIGLIYWGQGNFPKALDYYFLALKIAEENKDKKGIAETFGNMGFVYWSQRDYTKAMDYYLKAYKIGEELGDKNIVGIYLSRIGMIYWEQVDYITALDCFFKSLKIATETGNENLIAMDLGNISSVYAQQGNISKALEYKFKALEMQEKLGNKSGIAFNLVDIGSIYSGLKKYKEAEKYMLQALAIDTAMGSLLWTQYTYSRLSDLYSETGNYKKALESYKKAKIISDTIFNQEKNKEITRKEMNYEFDKKEAITKVENEKQQAVAEEKNRKQTIISWSVAVGLFLVLVFAGFVFRSLRITRKQKHIIELQKNEVSQQKEIIEKQKQIVEEKQKETVDSINYAKSIQYTLLANHDVLKQNLREHFVLFQPKDIVSGDFYWAASVKGNENRSARFYLAVCDSTGHGVPGAFMSLLNISFLNEAIIEKNIEQPDKILNYVRSRLIESISKDGAQDGMDGILMCIENEKITYAAANNVPLLVRENAIIDLHADKMPIGKGEKDMPFTLQTIDVQKGDTLYLYTDGYADQFGGPKGKKFMYKQLDNLLIATNQKSMEEQELSLSLTLEQWKGNLEQVDDILVVGIRV
ncbi:MAG: tetratricopeptide repeat protein [Bacteroidota bacterium]